MTAAQIRNLDWRFYSKISILGLGWVFFFLILTSGITSRLPKHQANPANTNLSYGNPISAPRIKIVLLNSMSILFLFLSLNEFRFYEYMDPIAIDSTLIQKECQKTMSFSIVIYIVIVIMFAYNFLIIWTENYLQEIRGTSNDDIRHVGGGTTSSSSSTPARQISSAINTLTTLLNAQTGDIVEKIGIIPVRSILPISIEKYLSIFVCFASLGICTSFIMINYFGKNTAAMKACIHSPVPQSHYVDIYNGETLPPKY